MKRLYFLFFLSLSTFLYSSEHSHGPIERRGSLPSFLEKFLGTKAGEPKPLFRCRTRSAGAEVFPKTKLTQTSSLPNLDLELKPEPALPISQDQITVWYNQALSYLEQSEHATDSQNKERLRMHAEVNLEILRRAHYTPAIELLLTRVYSYDIDTRSSGQISELEMSLLAHCAGNPQLLVYFNQLRMQRAQTQADSYTFERHKRALLEFIGLSVSEKFDETKAQKFKEQIEALTLKNKALEKQMRTL